MSISANLLTGLNADEIYTRTNGAGTNNYLTDALGSTIALTDTSGVIQTQYSYEPYGNATVMGASSDNAYQYTGRENDNTGLYYYRARYYHPVLQRFISEDPIGLAGGDVDFYTYVGGNPLTRIDPLGLWSVTFGGYIGPGFEITFGNDGGNGFMTGRIGLGVGAGFSYDPNGEMPGPPPRDRCGGGVVLSASGQAHFSFGPGNTDIEVGAARNYSNQQSSLYGGPAFSFSPSFDGLAAVGSIGGQITIYSGGH
ncbi:MAG: RHS repeat-associated core domain-containing protein [Sulfuriferula sp.]|nr:RHS repeat-associated core domain-containing protein [Sulfuriferula sp.]